MALEFDQYTPEEQPEYAPAQPPVDAGPGDPPNKSQEYFQATNFFKDKLATSFATRNDNLVTPYVTQPGTNTEKYLTADDGFSPLLDNEDYYARTQGTFEKIGKGLLKLPVLTLTKLGTGVGFMAGVANPVNWFGEERLISAAADNTIATFFEGMEEDVRNQWLPTFQDAKDREKGFFARALTDIDFWTDDMVDGLAFMASAWVPGMALSKLGLGAKTIQGLSKLGTLGRAGLAETVEASGSFAKYFANAAKYGQNLDKFNAWAMATTSEAMFEAKGVRDNILKSLENSSLTEAQKKQIAGDGAQNAFIMNAALLGVTNIFELPLVSKMLNKTEGLATGLMGGAKLGEEIAVKQATTKAGKFLQSGYGRFAKDATAGVFREGLIEENGQLAIQRFNEQYGAKGKVADMLDFDTYAGLGDQYLSQTKDAFFGEKTPESIETSTSIGLGGILGGGMTAISNARQAPKNKLTTEKAVEYYNKAQESWLKFGNIYETENVTGKDENGNDITTTRTKLDENNQPIVDKTKLAGVISGIKSNAAAMDVSDADTNMSRRNLVRDNAFADFVMAHINAGMEDGLLAKLDAVGKASPEDLAKLGFAADNTLQDQIARYKNLASTIIKQNKIINADIVFDGSNEDKARKARLTELAAQQAVYRGLVADEMKGYDAIRNEQVNSNNSSLSDGVVDQLNGLLLRIKTQEQFIKELKASGPELTKAQVSVAEEILAGLNDQLDQFKKNNETSIKELKTFNNGLYQYEKEERNTPAYLAPLLKKMKYKSELENQIQALGQEWGLYADFDNGKKNFLDMYIDQQIKNPINKEIDEEIAADELPPEAPAPTPPANPPAPTPVKTEAAPKPTQTYPELEEFLKQQYETYKKAAEAQGLKLLTFTEWKKTAGPSETKRWMDNKAKQQSATVTQTDPATGKVTGTVTTSTESLTDMEAKKADIERRRKEELDSVIQTTPIEILDESGNVVQTSDKRVAINAKYDAELAALEGGAPVVEEKKEEVVPEPVSTLEKDIEALDKQLQKDLGRPTELRFMKAGTIGYDKEGNKYEIVSKKDKYGRSLEYKKNDGPEQSFNPKTASTQYNSLGYYPEAFTELYDKDPKAILEQYAKDKAALEVTNEPVVTEETEEVPVTEETEDDTNDVKDFVQDINTYRTISNQNIALANAEFQEGLRQVAPSNSLANKTDNSEIVEFAPGMFRQERRDVNKNYIFDVATPTFMPGQAVTFKVMVDGFEPVVNAITGEKYDKTALFDENWNAVETMYDFVPIAVFANVRGKEVMIGTIHEPQWIERKIGSKYVNIAIPAEQLDQPVPDVVKAEVEKNRQLRKLILENYNQNHNFVVEGVVEDKSVGILRTTESVDMLRNRVNPKIAEGGTENRHGMFAIVKDGGLQSDRNVAIDNVLPTESFSPQNIANYQGVVVLMLPTSTGQMFPSFIKLPNVSTDQAEFIIEAWKAFTKQTTNPEIVKAVYDAMGLEQSADSFGIGVLRDYIHHYITIIDEKSITRTGNGSALPKGAARLNITNKGGLELQVNDASGWYATDEPIFSALDLPVDYLQKMTNLKTTVRFSSTKNDSLKGINSTEPATILSIKNGKLVKDKILYNQYIMDRAGTFVDKGIQSKNAYGDWVYFANPVVKMKPTNIVDPAGDVNEEKEVTPAPSVEEVNTPREDKGAALLAALRAKKLKDEQVQEQKENCSGLRSKLDNIM